MVADRSECTGYNFGYDQWSAKCMDQYNGILWHIAAATDKKDGQEIAEDGLLTDFIMNVPVSIVLYQTNDLV